MRVRELIEELKKYDGDMTVFLEPGIKVKCVTPGPLNYMYDKPEDQIVTIEYVAIGETID